MSYSSYIFEINPKAPFVDILNIPVGNQFIIEVEGETASTGTSFAVNVLQNDENQKALHFRPYFDRKKIVMNTYNNGWGKEEHVTTETLKRGSPFKIVINSDDDGFKIVVNDKETYTYKHRIKVDTAYRGVALVCGSATGDDVIFKSVDLKIPE